MCIFCEKNIDYIFSYIKLILSKKGEMIMTLNMSNYLSFVAEKVALIIIDIILVLNGLILG